MANRNSDAMKPDVMIKQAVRRMIPAWFLELGRSAVERLDPDLVISFSHQGEDRIALRRLDGLRHGFYVDVGAHHPTRFSNTLAFHRRGWRGINIDPNPDSIRLFNRARPNDINVCVGIANFDSSLTFHVFDEPAISTFDEAAAEELVRNSSYRLLERRQTRVRRLADVLEENLPEGQAIDLMSIDVEGLDLEVLQSNDWQRFRTRCLLVEDRDFDFARLDTSAVHVFMSSIGYRLIAKTMSTLVYEDTRR